MSNAKHTPGPWFTGWGNGISGPRVGPTAFLDDLGSKHLPIRTTDGAVAWVLCEKDDKHAEADTHLIAAAPELLEALKRFTAYGKIFGYKASEGCPYEQAMAVIAKATGGAA